MNLIVGVKINLNGSDLSEADLAIEELVIEQHTHLPSMFSLRIYDNGLVWLHGEQFDLTKEIEISIQHESSTYISMIKGEITSLEPIFQEGRQAELIIHGYDKSHRLYREVRSKAHVNKKDSDIAKEIAKNIGLTPKVEDSKTVYDHIYQHNQSDLNFLRSRAWRIGYECYVSGNELVFQKPKLNGGDVSLTWGNDLRSFRPRLTLAEQVDEVMVRGWDPEKQEPIKVSTNKATLHPKISEKKGSDWASAFGIGKKVIVEEPVQSEAEAEALANAHLDELSGSFIQAEGVAHRRPDICAGQMITLEKLGKRLSGDYLVTSATHVYKPSGFNTYFKVTGTRTGSLLSVLAAQKTPQTRWGGVVVGVVTNTEDPKNWGRVKVRYPWLSDKDKGESTWARVIGLGAGPTAGLYIMPAVDDEVFVAFELGDFNRPVVLGGVWNGDAHEIPKHAAAADSAQKPMVRTLQSREGHIITVDDIQHQIRIIGKDEKVSVLLDEQNGEITITSENKIILDTKSVEIKGSDEIKLDSKKIALDARNVSISGSQSIKLNG